MPRLVVCLTVLVAALVPWNGLLGQEAPAAVPQDTVPQLRRQLLDQLRRLDALEAAGAQADPAEIAALKALLAETDRRITALEEARGIAPPAPAAPGPAAPAAPAPQAVPAQVGQTSVDLAAAGEGGGDKKPAGTRWNKPYLPTFYGILKPRWGVSSTGRSEIGQSTSRLGLAMDYGFAEGFSVLAKYEMGINLTKQNALWVFPLHGPPQGQGKDPVYTRLGYGGIATPWGSLTVGKVNSTYYDIAGWTDQFWTYGGEASGAFGVADGGVAGTGRASTALQYRLDKGWFHLGFQSQHRNAESDNSTWFCTVGGSLRLDLGRYWTVGAAYQEVRDGVPAPEGIESKEGDKVFIAGLRFERGRWYAAADYSDTRQNQQDDKGVWFDARGLEVAVIYAPDRRWGFQLGYNRVGPTAPYAGLFRTDYALFTVTYAVKRTIVFSGELRFDSSRTATGERSFPQTIFVLGLDFGW